MTGEFSMSFPDPDRRLTLNDRLHWRQRAARVKAWRAATALYAMQAHAPKHIGPSNVRLTHTVTDPNRRRDPSNWIFTSKACVDGLVDAGVFDDDDHTHVTVLEPVFTKGPAGRTTIDITPRGAPWKP